MTYETALTMARRDHAGAPNGRAVGATKSGQDNLSRRRVWRRKPGPPATLSRREVALVVGLRRRGAERKFVVAELARLFGKRVSLKTVARTLSRFRVLGRRRSPVLTLLEDTRGAQRLDLARLVLDLDELAREPALDRTVERLERIRGVAYHRTQLARIVKWCASVGVRLEKEHESGPDARLLLDVVALRRVITKPVLEAAVAVRLEFERRKKS